MGQLARFIRFYTGEDDEGGRHNSSNVVGVGEVGYMILQPQAGSYADSAQADVSTLSE